MHVCVLSCPSCSLLGWPMSLYRASPLLLFFPLPFASHKQLKMRKTPHANTKQRLTCRLSLPVVSRSHLGGPISLAFLYASCHKLSCYSFILLSLNTVRTSSLLSYLLFFIFISSSLSSSGYSLLCIHYLHVCLVQ